MSPFNKPKATLNSYTVVGNHSEVVRKLSKPAQCPPSYNFTILTKPKNVSENRDRVVVHNEKRLEIHREVTTTTPIPCIQVNTLTETIRKTAHTSRAEKCEAIEIAFLNDIPWISAELVIGDNAATTYDTSLTSVTWAMSASDQSVVDAARVWFRSSSLAKRRTYTHGSVSAKTIQKRRERSMKGYHPLCQTVKDSLLPHTYL